MKMEMVLNGVQLVIDGDFTIQMRPVGSASAAPVAPVAVAPPVAAPASVARPAARPVASSPAADGGLFSRLSALRRELAAASGVPPYVVFQDRALHEMVAQMPQTLAEMGQISGVGAAKLEKYGDKFLAIIRAAA